MTQIDPEASKVQFESMPYIHKRATSVARIIIGQNVKSLIYFYTLNLKRKC